MTTVTINGVVYTFPDYPDAGNSDSSNGGGTTVVVPPVTQIDRELILTTYVVKTAFTGAIVGNTVSAMRVIDTSGDSPSQLGTTVWRNDTLNTVLAEPSMVNLDAAASTGLTNAQMIAALGTQSGVKTTAVAALGAGGTGILGWLSQIWDQLANKVTGVNTLAAVGVARQLTAGAASANTVLTTTTRRISIVARNADVRFLIGSATQTATATSHFISLGERLDIAVPATPNIALIRAGTTDGIIELSELI